MDLHQLLQFAPWASNLVIGAACLYVGKATSDLRVEILKDAEERERRVTAAIANLGDKFQARLDARADRS